MGREGVEFAVQLPFDGEEVVGGYTVEALGGRAGSGRD